MTGKRALSVSLFLALAVLAGCATKTESIDVRVWQHSIAIPDDDIETLGVFKDSLTVRFADNSMITFSVIDYKESPFPEDLTPYELVEAVYGKDEPDNPDFMVAREDMLEDADEHKVVEIQDGIKAYLFLSDDRNIAYVGDKQSERFFMMVDAKKRSFDDIIQSITRR